MLVSEDSLVEIKRKFYLQSMLIRLNYLHATLVSKVNPENKKNVQSVYLWLFQNQPTMFKKMTRNTHNTVVVVHSEADVFVTCSAFSFL